MTAHFTDQLNLLRDLEYRSCPGEEACETDLTGIIFGVRLRSPETPICEICEHCDYLPTKPGQEPPHLTRAIQTATELNTLKSAGAVFPYPDALTPFEWVCVAALQAAISASESESVRQRQSQVYQQSEETRLEYIRRK